MSDTIPEIMLERFVLSEIGPEDVERLSREVMADGRLATRIERLRTSSAEILSEHPTSLIGASIRRRLDERRSTASRAASWVRPGVLTGVVAILMAFALRTALPLPPAPAQEERVKGISKVSSLRVFRKTPTGSEPLTPGASAARGDLIRLGYETAVRRYGVIVSIDGRGVVTRHWPLDAEMATPLKSGDLVLLDRAFELDDAPRFERFYLVTSERPFPVGVVESAVRTGRDEIGPAGTAFAGLEWTSLELRKEASR